MKKIISVFLLVLIMVVVTELRKTVAISWQEITVSVGMSADESNRLLEITRTVATKYYVSYDEAFKVADILIQRQMRDPKEYEDTLSISFLYGRVSRLSYEDAGRFFILMRRDVGILTEDFERLGAGLWEIRKKAAVDHRFLTSVLTKLSFKLHLLSMEIDRHFKNYPKEANEKKLKVLLELAALTAVAGGTGIDEQSIANLLGSMIKADDAKAEQSLIGLVEAGGMSAKKFYEARQKMDFASIFKAIVEGIKRLGDMKR